MDNETIAIIDIGSNTIRLVIYKKKRNGTYREAVNIKAVARLRQYLNQDAVLSQKGIDKCVTILQGFQDILGFYGVMTEELRCVATATIRQAVNKNQIIDMIKDKLGFKVEILSESEEAYFGYLAVAHTTIYNHAVTIDIGGGSTEITYFRDKKLVESHSFPFGVVSLKERFFQDELGGRYDTDALNEYLIASLQTLSWLKGVKAPIIAIGGSARNIAQIHQHQCNYPLAGIHQYEMSTQELQEMEQKMAPMTVAELEKLEGLSKDRIDIIIPALEVFSEICRYVDATSFVFSKRGLRDGLLIDRTKVVDLDSESILTASIHGLLLDYGVSIKHAEHVSTLATKLYQEFAKVFGHVTNPSSEKIISHSAMLYFIGQYIDLDVASHHTFNLIANQSIDGLSHKDRLVVAMIASFKSKSLLKQYMNPFEHWFTKGEQEDIRIAGAIVKLASALDCTRRGLVKGVLVSRGKTSEQLDVQVFSTGNHFVEKSQVEKQVKHLEKALKHKVVFTFRSASL